MAVVSAICLLLATSPSRSVGSRVTIVPGVTAPTPTTPPRGRHRPPAGPSRAALGPQPHGRARAVSAAHAASLGGAAVRLDEAQAQFSKLTGDVPATTQALPVPEKVSDGLHRGLAAGLMLVPLAGLAAAVLVAGRTARQGWHDFLQPGRWRGRARAGAPRCAMTGSRVGAKVPKVEHTTRFDWRAEEKEQQNSRNFLSVLLGGWILAWSLFGGWSWTQANDLQAQLAQGGPPRTEELWKYSDSTFRADASGAGNGASGNQIVSAVSEVPSPRLTGGWVTDMVGALRPATVAQIDELCSSVRRSTGGEVAVVIVPQVSGGKDAVKPFATSLFNYWQIGERSKNNGVLVLVSVEDRRVEVEIGTGLNAAFNDAGWLQQMVDQQIIPSLRQNDWNSGVLAGIRAVTSKLALVDKAVSQPDSLRSQALFAAFAGVGVGSVAFVLLAQSSKAPDCSVCGQTMTRLGDALFEELAPGAQMEMNVGSVRHVLCGCCRPSCLQRWGEEARLKDKPSAGSIAVDGGKRIGALVERSREVRLSPEDVKRLAMNRDAMAIQCDVRGSSPYSSCARCGYRTALTVSEVMIPPTTFSDGSQTSVTDCCYCGSRDVFTSILPRIGESGGSNGYDTGSGDFSGGGSDGGGDGGDF